MALLIGVLLAIAIGLSGRLSGMDRDRAMYPIILVVIASYYVQFLSIDGFGRSAAIELGIALLFGACAVVGFRFSLWVVAVALALHGLFDFAHSSFSAGDGVPLWWPEFCLGVDIALAVFLGWLLVSGRVSARAAKQDIVADT